MKVEFTQIRKHIIEEINKAENSISIAVAWFTSEEFFHSLMILLKKGIVVELVINNDHINNRSNGLDLNKFIKLGGKLFFAHNSSLMHHKFVIIDDKILISGSYNWTYNAEFRNNENIILTKNVELINRFKQEFYNLKISGDYQNENVITPTKKNFDLDFKLFLSSDFYYKTIDEKEKGDLQKAQKSIKVARYFDNDNPQIEQMFSQIEREINSPQSIKIALNGIVNYGKGRINIPKSYSTLFANHEKVDIEIYLGDSKIPISKMMDRYSNNSKAPRINGGKELKSWIQNNFKKGDILTINILSNTSVRLTK